MALVGLEFNKKAGTMISCCLDLNDGDVDHPDGA
jgi:hypothetical protein